MRIALCPRCGSFSVERFGSAMFNSSRPACCLKKPVPTTSGSEERYAASRRRPINPEAPMTAVFMAMSL